jgi:hypothetical protein
MLIVEKEFLEWKQSDVTQQFFKALKSTRESLKENLIRGNYENEDFVKGKASAFFDLIEMSYEDFKEAVDGE